MFLLLYIILSLWFFFFTFNWADGNGEFQKWSVILRISTGIARGLNHLHTSLRKPIIMEI
ncbi:hypothetical protein Hanom_Chr04g00337961 [Helianthus anomalus]